jgi:hypothetical protein
MEGNLDKCLAFCQALVASNHQFTFALTIGKDNTFSFSTNDRGNDLKKAAPRQQSRRERRAVDPAVKQKATAHRAKVAAEKAAADAEKAATDAEKADADAEKAAADAEKAAVDAAEPVAAAAPLPEMVGAAAKEAKRGPCCRRCKQPVASHPGGARGCGASCINVLTPEKLLHASEQGDLSLATPEQGGREEQCTDCGAVMMEQHQCEDKIEAPATLKELEALFNENTNEMAKSLSSGLTKALSEAVSSFIANQ